MIGSSSTEINCAISLNSRGRARKKARKGKGFLGLVIVKFGRKIGVDLANLFEEPSMEPVGIVTGQNAVLGRLDG